jgi:hypothetical protein
MIIESIIVAIFICSFAGVVLMIARKVPKLSTLPKNGTTGIEKYRFFMHAEGKAKSFLAFFSEGIFLHKILSWTKCRVIKTETLIDGMLSKMRKKAKDKKLNQDK